MRLAKPSEEVIREVREECGPRIPLSFSTGKDSIATWLAIRDHFDEVVPYFLYLIPGLEFVEESLAYYEGLFGRKIIRLPHPSLYRWLNGYLFQTPSNYKVLRAADLPTFDYGLVADLVCEEAGLPPKSLTAIGVRAADSPMRRMAITRYGAINRTDRKWYPVWDWNKARLIEAITKSGVKLPVDYEVFGRTFDGLDLAFTYPMKKHFPRDYARVLEYFPLVEADIYRYERSLRS